MAFPPADKKDDKKDKALPFGKAAPFGRNRGKAAAKDVVGAARKGDTGAKASLALSRKEDEDEEGQFKRLENDESEMDMGDMLDDMPSEDTGQSDKYDEVLAIVDGDASKAQRICDIFKKE